MICHSRRPTAAKLSLLIAVERSPLKAKNSHYDFRTKEAKRKKDKRPYSNGRMAASIGLMATDEPDAASFLVRKGKHEN